MNNLYNFSNLISTNGRMMEMMEDKNYSVRAEIDRKRISAREKERGSVI